MGLDISVYKLIKLDSEEKKESHEFLRMTDYDGNRINNFPEWTKDFETDYEQGYYDWIAYRDKTGIDVTKLYFRMESHEENGNFMFFSKNNNDTTDDDWVQINLDDVPIVKKSIKIIGFEEIGYQRNGLNYKFYDDYTEGKIGYYVWSKKELERYKNEYCDEDHPSEYDRHYMVTPKADFQENIIDVFTEGENVVCFDW